LPFTILLFPDHPDIMLIRPATEADLPAIHALVYELAVYEKVTGVGDDHARRVPGGFSRNGLVPEPRRRDGRPGGRHGAVLHGLFDLAGQDAVPRRSGGERSRTAATASGSFLFDAVLAEGRRRGCRLVKWQVLDWNDAGAPDFYRKNQAVIETEWWNGKISVEF
jgi:hypothetical protein